VISPGLKVATPTVRLISSQCGGRIEETVTRFLLFYVGVAQRIFECCERVAVHADPARQKYGFGKWKHRHTQFLIDAARDAMCRVQCAIILRCRIPRQACDMQAQGTVKNIFMNIP
jgi:hypothetical protein